MKIRIEFDQPDDENIEPESSFDAVEITTSHASTLKDWAWAVLDFASTAGSLFDTAEIIKEAFLQSSASALCDWECIVCNMHKEQKQALLSALMQDKTKQDKEKS